MSKELLRLDINLKLSNLKNDVWFKNFIYDQLILIILLCINLLLGLTLKYLFKVTTGMLYCSISNLLITVFIMIRAYKLERVLNKTKDELLKIDELLKLLEDYDKFNEVEIYKEFQDISEIKLPELK